jgi:hypothetical protein
MAVVIGAESRIGPYQKLHDPIWENDWRVSRLWSTPYAGMAFAFRDSGSRLGILVHRCKPAPIRWGR